LIKQRLEEMEIAAVYQRHLNRRFPQGLGGVEPAEAAPQDHYAMLFFHAPP
jgi:hypothetical protein